MKALRITYSKTFSLGNYENEKIGIELEISEGELAADALVKAIQFVENNSSKAGEIITIRKRNYDKSKYILENKDDHTGRQVAQAQEFISNYEKQEEENSISF